MKIFYMEDDLTSMSSFLGFINQLGWKYTSYLPKKENLAKKEGLQEFLKEVCEVRPDIVILDAALTEKEGKFLDDFSPADDEILENRLSGLKYCAALAREHLGIPIIILTQYIRGYLARDAMRAGANRVLIKDSSSKYLADEIKKIVRSNTPHDSAFYWPMRKKLDSDPGIWQAGPLGKALDRFFLNTTDARRFGLFTASLRSILSPLFQGNQETEEKLMLDLVKSQELLSLVDSNLRDHVKHTGNVFWMGYSLLQEIREYQTPLELVGSISDLYPPGSLNEKEQILYAWTLATLFHDYGYLNERQSLLKKLVTSIVPDASIKFSNIRDTSSWSKNMRMLREFVQNLLGVEHFLYHYIDTVMTSFGNEMECHNDKHGKRLLLDHGLFSAHRLLEIIPFDRLDDQKKNIVLHAALAIACHNLPGILREYKFEEKCIGSLDVGTLPVCNLLAFCDNLQTWDRELNIDPVVTRTEAYDGFLERLVLSDTAYVSGSEIFEFSTSYQEDISKYNLKIRLKYFVNAAKGVDEVCEKLADDIQRWIDSGKIQDICKMMGFSQLIQGKLVYELPILSGTREISF